VAAVLIGDLVNVTVAGTLCGQRTLNSFPYRIEIAPSDTNYDNFASALNDIVTDTGGIYDAMRGALPSNWNASAIWVQVIRPIRLRKISFPLVSGGTWGAAAQTANIQASITRVGDTANRKNVGGVRIPISGDATASVNGLLTNTMKTALMALAVVMENNIVAPATVGTLVPLIGIPKTGNITADLVDAFPQDTTRVLRRRTVGLGI